MASEKQQTVEQVESGNPSGAAVLTPRPAPAPPRLDRLPPFRVLLHNDDVNDMIHVVRTITELTPLTKPEAVKRMAEAHNAGVALLLVTHRERAELYAEQFRSKRLTVTVEPGE